MRAAAPRRSPAIRAVIRARSANWLVRESCKGASYHARPASAHARPRTPGPGDWLDHFICFEFDAGRRVVGGTNKGFILYADVPE